MTVTNRHAENKRRLHGKLREVCSSADPESAARQLYTDAATCRAFHPVNDVTGPEAIVECLWRPILDALPGVERRDSILVAGKSGDGDAVAIMGHYQGVFSEPLFGIPPTRGNVHVRYGEVHFVADRRVTKSFVIVDLLDLMRQADCWPIAPSLGAEGMWPGPATGDGLRPDVVDAETGRQQLELVLRMHAGLLSFDGRTIESMNHAKFWTRDFMWYGPSGIGTTRGLAGFEAHHQLPFLRAFPDRRGGQHVVRVGDGNYAVTAGWPSVTATHTGGDWLGIAPTGKPVGMRVMDFYRNENGLIAENWVPIDVIHILRQLGVDVFERVRHRGGAPRRQL